MRFLISLICIALLLTVFAKPLRKYPAVFYVLALAADVVYAWAVFESIGSGPLLPFIHMMQRCTLAFFILAVVMFTGCFKHSSSIRNYLTPLRQPLSIIACILACCHIIFYIYNYLFATLSIAVPTTNLIVSLSIAFVLVVLFAILAVTSIKAVHAHMKPTTWKSVQKLAYPFFILIFIHLCIILLPPATAGNQEAIVSLAVYAIITVTYAIARIARAIADKDNVRNRAIADPIEDRASAGNGNRLDESGSFDFDDDLDFVSSPASR